MKPILHNGKGGAFREKSEVKPCSFLCLSICSNCGIMKMLNKFFCSIILQTVFHISFFFRGK